MALEIEGKIIRKLAVQSGKSARGDWSKQEFVIEYQDGNYPTQACLNVWGPEKVKDLEKYQIGDTVKVSFSISSREYNNRWYTDLRAWKIEGEAPVQESYTTGFAPTGALLRIRWMQPARSMASSEKETPVRQKTICHSRKNGKHEKENGAAFLQDRPIFLFIRHRQTVPAESRQGEMINMKIIRFKRDFVPVFVIYLIYL